MLSESPVSAVVPCMDVDRAKKFYTQTLGLKIAQDYEDQGALFACGNGTAIMVYLTQAKGGEATAAAWKVDDLTAVMNDLKNKGVVFEEYDLPGLKTVDGVAEMGDMKGAWFKDPDGNLLNIVNM